MAMQGDSGSRDSQMNSKVSVPNGKPAKTKSQPISGKLGGGMESMPGSKGKGPAIKTVDSQHMTGKVGRGMSAMGNDGVIDGFV